MRDIAVLSGIALIAVAAAGWIFSRARRDRGKRERDRHKLINENGRLIEGTVLDVREGIVYYSYSWRGVDYEAAQDVRALSGFLSDQPERLIGAVTVKFLPRDPSNSIVMSDDWNGFVRRPPG